MMPLQDTNPKISMTPSQCPEHNLPYDSYCSHQKCDTKIRVCSMCKNNHSDHLKFLTEKKQVIEDLNKGLRRCFQKIEEYDTRSSQLLKLMKIASQRASVEYETMENQLIQKMKQEKTIIQEKANKMRQIATKIEQKEKIKRYFAKMYQNKLLQLRIKLSTVEGMKNFKQKSQKLRDLTSKSNSEQIYKLYEEFYMHRKDLNEFLQNNITFKVGQIIALKNSKKAKQNQQTTKDKITKDNRRQIHDEKENIVKNGRKQKPKAKTTLNFGQGIISGILNFLNF